MRAHCATRISTRTRSRRAKSDLSRLRRRGPASRWSISAFSRCRTPTSRARCPTSRKRSTRCIPWSASGASSSSSASSRRRRRSSATTPYFSSYSTSWLEHCAAHVARSVDRLALGDRSLGGRSRQQRRVSAQIVRRARHPRARHRAAANVADEARRKRDTHAHGVLRRGRSSRIATEHGRADMMLANNVLAHVPDIHDFVEGSGACWPTTGSRRSSSHIWCRCSSKRSSTRSTRAFSYLSLLALEPVFAAHGLAVVDVDRIPTHGGSLRLGGSRTPNRGTARRRRSTSCGVSSFARGLAELSTYRAFAPRVRKIKNDFAALS